MSTLTPSQIDAARRALHHAAQERIDPSDLPSLIAAEQRHRCLLAARLSERDLAADERTAVVNGIAFADTKLIEYGVLAGRHRQAMKFPDYPAPHPSDDLGPRFAAARWIDLVDLAQTLTGQTAIKRGDRHLIRCPFHDDRHPSLTIFGPGRGWYCFPCQVGGSAVDFVMRLKHGNAVEALLLIEELTDTAPQSFGGERRS